VTTLRRIVLAVGGSVVVSLLARLWLVDILGVLSWESWVRVRESIFYALAALVAGYIAYELLRAWTDRQFGLSARDAPGIGGDSGEAVPASRIVSVLPVFRGVLAGLIVAGAGLVALSHLGVNVTPLIAGAGIFGLALSFGSQALVRDVVSGVFYMFDDAFRVGEYIAAGKYKGNVERIALRSVRLRHQNGQVHTIPYGQLGAVTNFSRDYLTIKFNLRLARDTDVDRLRKLVKGLGQEMLEDPELGKEFLQPLRMQGVADIEDNALVCRFKFTVRPSRPTLIQREAVKRIYRACTENGIEFATRAIMVKALPGAETSDADSKLATIAVAAFPDTAISGRR
jgi:small-conductance mechanosensitive channel